MILHFVKISGLLRFSKTYYGQCPSKMIKYTNNSFLATKISFINQISSLCQNIAGTNVDDIAEAIGIDPRIGSAIKIITQISFEFEDELILKRSIKK